MPIVVNNTYQLSVNGTIGEQPWANVFHVQLLGGAPPTPIEAADLMFATYVDQFCLLQGDGVFVNSVSYVDLDSLTGDSGTYVPETPGQGAAVNNQVPPNVAFLGTWVALGGRAYRNGRTYFPGGDESSVDDSGVISGPVVENWAEAMTAFRVVLDGGSLALSIVSKTSETTGIARTVTGEAMQSRVATQRRRVR